MTDLGWMKTNDANRQAIVAREIWQDNEYRLSPAHLCGSGTVLDLGANPGVFAAYAAHCRARRVVCYEAHPDCYRALLANVARLSADHTGVRFDVRPIAAARVDGAVWWQPCNTMIINGSLTDEPSEGSQRMEARSLASVIADAGDVDFMKVDIEGSEFDLFAGDASALSRVRRIAMEHHAETDRELGDLVTRLVRTHRVEVLGWPGRGGYLWAVRYDEGPFGACA